jgi:hypothetical protein
LNAYCSICPTEWILLQYSMECIEIPAWHPQVHLKFKFTVSRRRLGGQKRRSKSKFIRMASSNSSSSDLRITNVVPELAEWMGKALSPTKTLLRLLIYINEDCT